MLSYKCILHYQLIKGKSQSHTFLLLVIQKYIKKKCKKNFIKCSKNIGRKKSHTFFHKEEGGAGGSKNNYGTISYLSFKLIPKITNNETIRGYLFISDLDNSVY